MSITRDYISELPRNSQQLALGILAAYRFDSKYEDNIHAAIQALQLLGCPQFQIDIMHAVLRTLRQIEK